MSKNGLEDTYKGTKKKRLNHKMAKPLLLQARLAGLSA